jgi:uncharacterized protein
MIMLYKNNLFVFTIIIISLFASSIWAFDSVDIPVPKMHVNDRVNIIDNQTKSRLNAFLSELETKTGAQMIVLTVKTTDGMPIDQFSIDLANKWKLGQFGQNNGILMVISKDDRKYRIEVGSGLERILTNNFCEEIGKALFIPNFRNGNYNEGIYQGTVAIVNKIAKDSDVTITGAPQRIHLPRRRSTGLSYLPILLIFILPLLLGGSRRSRRHWGGMPFFMMMPFMFGGFGGHRGGGTYTSDGFGGFGGGLGGGFGGGGASGGW